MRAKMGTSESMVKCAFAEFLGCWLAGGEATLSLSTKEGNTTFTFATSLGSPGAPLHPPSPSPPRPRRRRGPARRKRDQERAARHQATLATSLSSSTSSNSSSNPLLTDPVEAVVEKEKAAEVQTPRTCKRCNLPCKGHPAPGYGEGRCQVTLSTPNTPSPLENLRSSTPKRDLSTSSNLDHTRDEEVTSPPPELKTSKLEFYEEWKERNIEWDKRYEERKKEDEKERNKRRKEREERNRLK